MAALIRVFLDTEFTGLGQRWPRLISIGLIAEDGAEFYAELPAAGYQDKLTPWVTDNVLPLLQGGASIMSPAELRERLAAWIAARGAAVIACDSLDDFRFLSAMLEGCWPPELAARPHLLALNDQRFKAALDDAFARGLRRHHALDDARANRAAWRAAP